MARPADPSDGPTLLEPLWRRRLVLAVCLVAGVLLGLLASSLQQERYVAKARVFLSFSGEFDPLGQGNFSNDPDRYVVKQAEVMMSSPILQRVSDSLDLDEEPWQLKRRVEAVATGSSEVVDVTAEDDDAQQAADIANAVVAAYRQEKAAQVEATVDRAVAEQSDADARAQIRTGAAVYADGVGVVEEADVPGDPASPQPVRDAVLLGLLGLLVGCAWVLFGEARGGRDRWARRAAEVLDAPVLDDAGGAVLALGYRLPVQRGIVLVSAVGLTGPEHVRPPARSVADAAAASGQRVVVLQLEPGAAPDRLEGYASVEALPVGARLALPPEGLAGAGTAEVVPVWTGGLSATAAVDSARALLDAVQGEADLYVVDPASGSGTTDGLAALGAVDGLLLVVGPATTVADLTALRTRVGLAETVVAAVLPRSLTPQPTAAGRSVATTGGPGPLERPRRARRGDDPAPGEQGFSGLLHGTSPVEDHVVVVDDSGDEAVPRGQARSGG